MAESNSGNAQSECAYYQAAPTGTYLCGHRFYEVTLCRRLNRDPAGFAGGPTLYQYCGTKPATLSDPSKLWGHPYDEHFNVDGPSGDWDQDARDAGYNPFVLGTAGFASQFLVLGAGAWTLAGAGAAEAATACTVIGVAGTEAEENGAVPELALFGAQGAAE